MPSQIKTLVAPVILLAGLSAAGESAAQQAPAKEAPLYPALCRPSSAKLEILSPSGFSIKLPPGQAAATIQYRLKVSPGVADPRCAEHYPNWQPAGWTVKTVFGRAQKTEFESNDIADFTWQAGGTATLGAGQWVMLSQVVLPEIGASKTVAFTIEQEQVSGPAKIAKTDRRGPRKRERPEPEEGGGKGDTEGSGEGKGGEEGQGGGGEKDGGGSQILSDLLSKIPGPKEKGSEKGGDATETAQPSADPAATEQPTGDVKETKEPSKADPKWTVNPKVLAGTKLATNPKLATKTHLQRTKLLQQPNARTKSVKVNVQARTRMVCHTRRVGSKLQRQCVRRS